jgi:hypothetical protein
MTQPYTVDEKRRSDLQRSVLEYLHQHGPKQWVALYSRFSLTSDVPVAPVLKELKDCGHIEVTNQGNLIVAAITESGLNRLATSDQQEALLAQHPRKSLIPHR